LAIIQKIISTNLATHPDMNVEKNQDPSIFLATYWNLSQKSGNLDFFPSKSGKTWLLFLENPFVG